MRVWLLFSSVFAWALLTFFFSFGQEGFSARAANSNSDSTLNEGRALTETCRGCHGVSTYHTVYPSYSVPKIAGQNKEYLIAALKAYRSGSRPHATMQAQAANLSDQEIETIAAYLSQQTSKVTSKEDHLVIDRVVSANCVQCHGADGLGIADNYPVLAGQYDNYLLHALKQYRSGERVNPLMSAFVASLSDDDIEVLARYYSKLNYLQPLK